MKNLISKSKSLMLDKWNLYNILFIALAWALSIYAANTEVINNIIAKHFWEDVTTIIIIILAFFVKEFLSDYSDEKWSEDI